MIFLIRQMSFRHLTTVAALSIGLGACSTDSPTAPNASSLAPVAPVSAATTAAIASDIAKAAGNSIATDIQNLTANEIAAVGSSFTVITARFDGVTGATGGTAGATPNCVESSEKGVYFCTKEPPSSEHASCKYSEERKLFICTRQAPPAGDHPGDQPGGSETCTFSSVTQLYTCTKSSQESIVRSYGFFDADGKPMASFVKGVTASIHYLVKIDGSIAIDSTFTAVKHALRDQIVSGFLGNTRIWNGFGSSADTNTHRAALSTRTYSGLAVDTLKAVTFAAERSTQPYPLSGVSVRVVNYTVVSTGRQTETTTVSRRIVVTFNGTADVPITLGDYSCTLHLDTKKVDGCK